MKPESSLTPAFSRKVVIELLDKEWGNNVPIEVVADLVYAIGEVLAAPHVDWVESEIRELAARAAKKALGIKKGGELGDPRA